MKKALALDIGGTKIYYALINENGEICSEIHKEHTPKNLDEFKELLKKIFSSADADVVAISTAGAVNNENTKVISSTGNLVKGYNSIVFQDLTEKPVYLENDANCAAWAEHIIGASKGCTNSIMITLGTGVGGGIILNNKLYKGKSGGAGEMHFKLYNDKRRQCTCKAWDCFEAYTSGPGLKKTAEEITKNSDVTTYDVIDGLKNNDKTMKMVYDKWQNDIIAGCIGLVNLFDPDCIVFSGSMAEFIDIKFIEESTNKEIITSPAKFFKATTGNYAGMIGAALLALGEKVG